MMLEGSEGKGKRSVLKIMAHSHGYHWTSVLQIAVSASYDTKIGYIQFLRAGAKKITI